MSASKEFRRKHQFLMSEIREVLLREWDPIGIRDEPMAQDEYDGYVLGILGLLLRGASEIDLSVRLRQLEMNIMGTCVDQQHSLLIARRLWEIGRQLPKS